MGDEGGDEVAEEGLAVGGIAVQMPVFQRTASHRGGGWRVENLMKG